MKTKPEALDQYGCDENTVHPDCPEHGETGIDTKTEHMPTPLEKFRAARSAQAEGN